MSAVGSALVVALVAPVAIAADAPVISEEMRQAAQRASKVEIPAATQDRVKELMKDLNSDEWRARNERMRAEALRSVGLEPPPATASTSSAQPQKTPGKTDRLYVFVSSAMPMETLRNYASSLEKVPDGVMVLRGFVGGARAVGPTAKFVSMVLKREVTCEGVQCALRPVELQIDPLVYRRYAIRRVPAVVYEENASPDGYCAMGMNDAQAPRATEVVYGDAALSFVLDTIYRKTKQPGLTRMAAQLNQRW